MQLKRRCSQGARLGKRRPSRSAREDTGRGQRTEATMNAECKRRVLGEQSGGQSSPRSSMGTKTSTSCQRVKANSSPLRTHGRMHIHTHRPLDQQIRCSIVVSIPACHADDPGSVPGGGVLLRIGNMGGGCAFSVGCGPFLL